MRLNEKHIRLLKLLLNDSISLDRLSFEINISKKSIVTYIGHLNNYFNNEMEIYKKGNQFNLLIKNEDRFLKKLKDLEEELNNKLNKDNSLINNVLSVLLDNHPVLIDDLAERFYVSKDVIHNIINEIRKTSRTYDVKIIGKPNVGLYLSGEEYNIRKLVIDHFPGSVKNISLNEKLLNEFLYLSKELKLDNNTYESLKTALKVTIKRIKSNCFMSSKSLNYSYIYESLEYKSLKFTTDYLKNINSHINSKEEILILVTQLIGRRATFLDEIISSNDEKIINQIITQTIKDVKKYFNIQIDKSLFSKDIRLHIKHLINRLIFNIKIKTDIGLDISSQFPFAFELSKVLGSNISKVANIEVSKDELNYLTIYFSVYLERLEQNLNDIKTIILITQEGLSVKKLLINNISNIFGNTININTIDRYEDLNNIEKDYDLIISTIINRNSTDKVIYIDNPFDRNLLKSKIEQFLIYKEYLIKNNFRKPIILDFVKESDFYIFNDNLYYQQYIDYLADELIKENKVTSHFKYKLNKREKKSNTITGHLGFPHTGYNGDDICIKIAFLNTQCLDYKDLKIIILIATPDSMKNEYLLIKIYEEILSIASNNYLISKLQNHNNFQDFSKTLIEEMSE
ncbi:BglG family transcription antiterminator [Staphylococcus epidermidis]|uniref:Sorbitol operon transcription regulator n=1 Tax=Staphylococcus epidermidis TaxID=1282 RepID=A0A109WUM5_STAEP|nr:PRD domain-containing protein [Staphylococcus epidermidis]AME30199.1 sorbitol operon transcription regulator [Staphylococcus epidermidis]